ncbi:MAG TPA: Bax inhibitor-1 family protein, partial [Nannocystaceae bacterium]|nr:Bax inhibitor-1 family protein [Nannocystaceae bacterium]
RSPVAAAIGVGVAALGVAALFVFGQRTRRDLGPWAPRLRMALVGALFALAANVVLLREPALDEAVQTVLAVVFAGHAGLDSQRLRQLYLARGERGNLLVLGAAHLYFDLVNVALALVGLLAGPR